MAKSRKRIETKIDALWLEQYAKLKLEGSDRGDFLKFRKKIRRKNTKIANAELQSWLSIFDFSIEWLTYIHVALTAEKGLGPKTPECRVAWALTGAACGFGFSISQLCLQGFDTPARALLRTFNEALLLCIATLHDEKLRDEYQKAEEDKDIVNFWHNSASPKNLHKRIMQIEADAGIDAATISEIAEWRREEYEVQAQSTHLSYVAAALTCL